MHPAAGEGSSEPSETIQQLLAAGDADTRRALLRGLGATHRAHALDALLEWLAMREVRPAARHDLVATFDALADLGDARAAPALLELCRGDEASGLHDERGFAIPLRELAMQTLRRLQRRHPELVLPAAAATPPRVTASGPLHPPQAAAQPQTPPVGRARQIARWSGWPLALGLFAPLWAVAVVLMARDGQGHLVLSQPGRRALALLAVLPALSGFLVALHRLLAGATASRAQRGAALCSALLCLLVLKAFWRDLF